MHIGNCEHCNEKKYAGGQYNFSCAGCRDRVLMDEPCKLARKALAARIVLWGEIPDWQREPSCGCKNRCKRRESAEAAEAELKAMKQRKYDAY
jgi:hypothetical protein